MGVVGEKVVEVAVKVLLLMQPRFHDYIITSCRTLRLVTLMPVRHAHATWMGKGANRRARARPDRGVNGGNRGEGRSQMRKVRCEWL